MKVAIILALVAMVAARPVRLTDAEVETNFTAYKMKFNKMYESDAAHAHAMANFKNSLNFIAEHNAKGATWTAGLTQFSDLTA